MKHTLQQTLLCILCVLFFHTLPAAEAAAKTYRTRAITALNERCYSIAIDYIDKYLPLINDEEPQRQEAYLIKATALLKNKEPQKSLDLLNNYSKLPNVHTPNKQFFYLKAEIFAELNQWQEACNCLDKAIDPAKPSASPDEILLLAKCHLRLGQYAKAEKYLQDYYQQHPNDTHTQLLFCHVETLLAQKKHQRALQLLNTQNNLQYKTQTELLKIRCLLQANKTSEAQAAFDKIINYMPENSDYEWFTTIYELNDALLKENKTDKLALYLSYAEKMAYTPLEKAKAFVMTFQYALRKNDATKAQNALDGMTKTGGHQAQVIDMAMQLAQLQEKNGNYNRAAELYLEIGKPGSPKQYQAMFNAACCLEKAGKLDDAFKHYTQAEKWAYSDEDRAQAALQASLVAMERYKRYASTSQLQFQPAVTTLLHCATYGDSRNPKVAIIGLTAFIRLAELHNSVGSYPEVIRFLERFFKSNIASTHPEYAYAEYLRLITERHTASQVPQKREIMKKLIALGDKSASVATQSYLEAFVIASECKLDSFAELALEKIIRKKQYKVPEFELALRQRIFYRLAWGKIEPAAADYEEYVKHFSSPAENDILCLALGDAFSNSKDYATALNYYTRSIEGRSDSGVYRRLYEAAQCCYQMKQYQKALGYISKLPAISSENHLEASDLQLLCRAIYLQGEIYTLNKNFAEAYTSYKKCHGAASDALLKLSALGRMGDMQMQQGVQQINEQASTKLFIEAEKCYTQLLDTDPKILPVTHELRFIAKSHKAVCLVRQKRVEEGLRMYEELYIDLCTYKNDINQAFYASYFQNTVLDLGILLSTKKDRASLDKLLKYYEALRNANLPLSDTANERIEKIKKQLQKR